MFYFTNLHWDGVEEFGDIATCIRIDTSIFRPGDHQKKIKIKIKIKNKKKGGGE